MAASSTASMEGVGVRLLKIDPRPTTYDSVGEATFAADDAGMIDHDIEMDVWAPIQPPAPERPPQLAFVDGVERRDARIAAEGEGMPLPGLLVSYAAGAMCPGRKTPLCHERVRRNVIVAAGARPETIRLEAANGCVEYTPAHHAEADAESLDSTLKDRRAQLEAQVVRQLIADGAELIVVDGRLPPNTGDGAVGLIKTPHILPISDDERVSLLTRLKTGERSPVFVRRRSDRAYYSWFVCLRTPGDSDLALSGLALMEMEDDTPREDAIRAADLTAAMLPAYASTTFRDARAPQNLLPVGQLERELRHRLGDLELLRRLLFAAFRKETPAWEP